MKTNPYIVYVKINVSNFIIAVDSSPFMKDADGWVEIDSGYGDRYYLAQNNYFPKPIWTDGGAYHYKMVDGKPVECTQDEIKAQEQVWKPKPVEPENSVWDELDAAYWEGVNSI